MMCGVGRDCVTKANFGGTGADPRLTCRLLLAGGSVMWEG